MNPALFGDTFREFIVTDAMANKTGTPLEEHWRWNLYQYGTCTIYVVSGCVIVCPLVQKRNYKSKQRQKILIVDGLSLIFCLLRSINLLFAFRQGTVATSCLIFFWATGTVFLLTTLAVFLFILWSTTKLEPMIWHLKNTLAIAMIVVVNVILAVCKEIAFNFSISKDISTLMTNLLLMCSLVNGTVFLTVGICLCGTFKKMTKNRRPSIRLVKDSTKRKTIQTKVVHTDVENFNSMVRKLRFIAFLSFLMFGIYFYTNIKLLIIHNYPDKYVINEIEVFSVELSIRIIEISVTILIFCVGFFSPQHKEAAMQWIRSLSQSRSHEELSTRRTNSVDSGRDTASDGKTRSGTLEACTSEFNNEVIVEMTSITTSKVCEYTYTDIVMSSSLKQDNKYLMVPGSLPQKEL